jgi:hypothetical protein
VPDRERTSVYQAGDLSTKFDGSTKLVNLEAIVDVELLMLLFRRNSGTFQCCNWNVSLAAPLLDHHGRVFPGQPECRDRFRRHDCRAEPQPTPSFLWRPRHTERFLSFAMLMMQK